MSDSILNSDIEKLALQVRGEIGRAKELSTTNDVHDVFLSLETLIGALAYLISPKTLLEQKYRQLVVQYEDEGRSHASAEARAKASDEYREWRKYEMLCSLAEEQIMALKKFKDDIAMEHRRS